MQSCKTARAQSTTGSERPDEANGDTPKDESEVDDVDELVDAVDATDAGGAIPVLGLNNTSEERDRSLGLELFRFAFTWAFAKALGYISVLSSSSNSGRDGRYDREPCMIERELGTVPVTLGLFFSFLVTFRLLAGPVDHAICECGIGSEEPKVDDFFAAAYLELVELLDGVIAAFFLPEAAPRRVEVCGEKEEKNLGDPDDAAVLDKVEASMGAQVSRNAAAGTAAGSSLAGAGVAARAARFCQRIFSAGEAECVTLLQLKL
jgi:hypothetical protein